MLIQAYSNLFKISWFKLIQAHWSLLKFNYIAKKGDKKTKEIDIDNFVAVKNWKAIGNKIIGYNRLSSFKIEKAKMDSSDNNNDSENLELTLF